MALIKFPEVNQYLKMQTETLKIQFRHNYELEHLPEGKLKLLEEEMDKIKSIIGLPFFAGLNQVVNLKMNELEDPGLKKKTLEVLKGLSQFDGISLKDIENNFLKNANLSPKEKQVYKGLFQITKRHIEPPRGSQRPLSEKAGMKMLEDYSSLVLRYYHLREYLNYLQLIHTESKDSNKTFLKMQWLGSQRDLAELFIELEAKGYIPKADSRKIKTCFTRSATIEQLLNFKDEYNDDTKRYAYPKVYQSDTRNKFEKILPNNKSKAQR